MHAIHEALLETLRAVQTFLDGVKALIAPINESGARKALDDVVEQLTMRSVDQNAGRVNGRGETTRQRKLRDALRIGQMKPIADIASVTLSEEPRLSDFVAPNARASSTHLIACAGAMADAAKAYQSVFTARGLPEDFIAQLQAASDALEESLSNRAQSLSRSRGATAAMSPLVKQGRGALRVLDSLMTRTLQPGDRVLGEWRAVKVIRTKPGRPRGSAASGEMSNGTSVTPIVPVVQSSSIAPVPPAAPAVSETTAA